ncbi:MAG: hypothetical protein IPH34_04040 [Chitinophagaceae bacterium]|nr:hypothetical protein [Chitinophagaceae bacterium]
MENLDIIILTIIVSLLFLVFIIATYQELTSAKLTKTKFGKETGPRAAMIEFIGKIFTGENIETTEKEKLIELMKKSLKDLEKDTE